MNLNNIRNSLVVGISLLWLFVWNVPDALAEQPVCDPIEGGSLSPCEVPKYVDPLVIPPAMRPFGKGGLNSSRKGKWNGNGKEGANGVSLFKIAVRQFQQRILPSAGFGPMEDPFPMTTVWGYGRLGDPLPGPGVASSFNYPSFTLETRSRERVRVHWVNGLMDEDRNFLPHLLPVDPTLHWANPGQEECTDGAFRTDCTPVEPSQDFYLGPVPMVTHVHGAHVDAVSDGYPEAWYLPAARNIPDGFATRGSNFGTVSAAAPGQAVFEYDNSQRAATLWYHDHSLGLTRLNVYAGMAGFWLVRDDIEDALNLPGPAPMLGDRPGTKYFEIPIAIQDRSFNEDGSLFYPDTWNPVFFGNMMVVNGKTWPHLEVEPRLYRFRLLNGCNSRFLILKTDPEVTFHQIGNEAGLIPSSPIELSELLIAPAERADVIVDFSDFEPGTTITLLNLGPDTPFRRLPVGTPADPASTGQVMQFRVVPLTGQGNPGQIPEDEDMPSAEELGIVLGPADDVRDVGLFQGAEFLLGTVDPDTFSLAPLKWDEPVTENPQLDSVEIWRLHNLTADAHPIHLHLVAFEVLGRDPYPLADDVDELIPPNPWERGTKDTVIALPGEITWIKAKFDRAGLYVWHCHILEHEDNEMMRPFFVGEPAEIPDP
jgi:FtsP/CotA-like multicopper oxidase with cupredoxin domain